MVLFFFSLHSLEGSGSFWLLTTVLVSSWPLIYDSASFANPWDAPQWEIEFIHRWAKKYHHANHLVCVPCFCATFPLRRLAFNKSVEFLGNWIQVRSTSELASNTTGRPARSAKSSGVLNPGNALSPPTGVSSAFQRRCLGEWTFYTKSVKEPGRGCRPCASRLTFSALTWGARLRLRGQLSPHVTPRGDPHARGQPAKYEFSCSRSTCSLSFRQWEFGLPLVFPPYASCCCCNRYCRSPGAPVKAVLLTTHPG